jgi:hypothetical protein
VAKKRHHDERTRLLRRLRRRRFDRIRFKGLDALVARVTNSETVPAAVQTRIDRGPPQRWYPQSDGAYLVRWPYTGGAVPSENFQFEPGGWDHEHCDGCNRHIKVGHTFWQTRRGSCFWLCPYCYRRLLELSRDGAGAASKRDGG